MDNSKQRTSKFIREYGMTLKEMSLKYNFTIHYLWILHQRGDLHKFIQEQEENKEKVGIR